MLFNIISKRSLLSAALISALVLSCGGPASAGDQKLFKIKNKPADTKQITEDEVAIPEKEEVSEKPAPAKKQKKQAAPAKAEKAVKKQTEQTSEKAEQPAAETGTKRINRISEELKKLGKSSSTTPVKESSSVNASAYDEYGIMTEEKVFSKASGDVPVHVVKVDLKKGKVVPKIVLAEGKIGTKGTLTKICESFGAVAGINGSFFDVKTYAAIGYLMIDGKAIQAPLIVKSRTTFGITTDNRVMIGKPKFRRRIRPENEFFSMIDGINRKCGGSEIVIFTEEYGKNATVPEGGVGFKFNGEGIVTEVVKGKSAIPQEGGILVVTDSHLHRFKSVEPGVKILFTQTLMSPWDKARDAFGSGMLLVTDGKVTFDQTREEVGKYLMGDAPRTAIGITADNELVMVVADGRGRGYRGVDFDEIAQIMVDCGCTDAIALDGGGSSTLVYKDRVLNVPSDKGGERKIANALVILPVDGKK